MKAPLSWLREYVSTDATDAEIARRLTISSLEVDRLVDVGVTDEGGNLAHFVVGRVISADPHPNADRLQLCQVDVGNPDPQQIVCGAWNFGAGATVAVGPSRRAPARLPRAARGAAAPRRGVPRDDPRGGRDRARRRPRRDHAAPRRARARDAARGRPAARRPRARRDADDEPARPALDGRHRARDRRAVRRRAPAAGCRTIRRLSRDERLDIAVEDFLGCPRYIGRAFRDVRVGPSPQWLRAGSISRGCAPSRTSST